MHSDEDDNDYCVVWVCNTIVEAVQQCTDPPPLLEMMGFSTLRDNDDKDEWEVNC